MRIFSPVVLCPGTYTEVFNSNAAEYGGTGLVNSEPIEAVKESWDFKDYSIKYHLGAYGVCIFKFDYVEPKPEEPTETGETLYQRRYSQIGRSL